jgi:hypothetical protein
MIYRRWVVKAIAAIGLIVAGYQFHSLWERFELLKLNTKRLEGMMSYDNEQRITR